MKTIRANTFDTNSSSTHTLSILPNSAINIPIGQTIELKFTKKDKWDYEIDSNWKLFRLFNSNKEGTLKYLNLDEIFKEISSKLIKYDFNLVVLNRLKFENTEELLEYIKMSHYKAK